MFGITRFGAYVPTTRLPLALIHGGRATDSGPRKAVAGFDEDAVTLAVAAAIDCLGGMERSTIDALYFASTTSPFREKQGAALISKALDLPRQAATVDFGGSLRAGAGALLAAINAVKAGQAKQVLVIASDCRLAAPRSPLERNMGDAAAAFLIGSDKVIAKFEGSAAVNDEILDVWRGEHDSYLKSWEDRFNVMHGYQDNMVEACRNLLEKLGRNPQDYQRAVLYGPDARSHGSTARAIGFEARQIQEPLFGQVGNCGAAFAPLLLVAALEKSTPAEKLLLGFYGDGAEAMSFETTADIEVYRPQRGLDWHLKRGEALRSYDSYLSSRQLEASEFDRRAGDGIPATVHFRERDTDISFLAMRCKSCGTMHFPACRVCYGCYSKDNFEAQRLSDRTGKVLSYSFDYFFPSPEPPLVVGMCEVDGGARVYVQMTDVKPDMLRCDMPVDFVFRKIHEAGNKPNYFWKSRPLTDAAAQDGSMQT